MKVLRVITSMNPKSGGPCQGVRNSIPNLENLGVANEVVCLDDPSNSFLSNDSFIIHPLGDSSNPWAYTSNLVPWLENNIIRFDVVIIHGLWLYHSFAVINTVKKMSQSPKVKVFIMPHGMLDPWFQKAKGRRLKALRNWFYWHLIEKKVVNHADGILFTCEQELLLARETFSGYNPQTELNVGYGIQPPPHESLTMSDSFKTKWLFGSKPYILYLSRIHEKKGTDLLVEAYLSLKKRGVKLPVLVIAGPGIETSFGARIRRMASSDSEIVFPGMLLGEIKWGAIYGCEAFILPSHQENFGISVAEALACGKLVLITNQVNIWKEISEGGGGLVEEDTLEGTESLLRKFVDLSSTQREEMEMNAKLIYQKHFTIEQAAKRMQEVLINATVSKV